MKLAYDYSNNLLKRVRDFNGSTVFWEVTNTDAWGHIQDETFGNGVMTFTDFDQASGLMQSREGGIGGGTGLIDSHVTWDPNGNLSSRQDLKLNPAVIETFTYDSLNRFDSSQRNGVTNADVALNAIGNITSKLGVGNYSYHAIKKRAVIAAGSHSYGYDANGNMTSRDVSSISYTSYNLPSMINSAGNSSTLLYGAFRNRFKQVAVTAGTTETTIYVGGLLEKMTRGSLTKWRHLIHGGQGLAAVYTRRSGSASTTDTAYLHRDHLGSPELLTDENGVLIVRPSFGAYGERRDGSDWDGPPSGPDLSTLGNYRRDGFTGHEHLDSVGLIHMNGRVYDPAAARLLTRDPLIAHDLGSQSVNGYAYALNSPLTFQDPTGFLPGRNGPWQCKQEDKGKGREDWTCREDPQPRDQSPQPEKRPGRHDDGTGGGERPDKRGEKPDKPDCMFDPLRAAALRSDPDNAENLVGGTYPSMSNGFAAGYYGGIQFENTYLADFTTRSVHKLSYVGGQFGFKFGASVQWSGGSGNRNHSVVADRGAAGWGDSGGAALIAGVGGALSKDGDTWTTTTGIGLDIGFSYGFGKTEYEQAWPVEDLQEQFPELAEF